MWRGRPPLLYKEIINVGIGQRDGALVVRLTLALLAIAVTGAALSLAQGKISARIGTGVIFDLRSAAFDHLLHAPLAFYTHTRTGALTSRLNNDVLGVQAVFTRTVPGWLGNGLSIVLVLVFMTVLSPPVALAAVALLPLYLLAATWIARRRSVSSSAAVIAAYLGEGDSDDDEPAGEATPPLVDATREPA